MLSKLWISRSAIHLKSAYAMFVSGQILVMRFTIGKMMLKHRSGNTFYIFISKKGQKHDDVLLQIVSEYSDLDI